MQTLGPAFEPASPLALNLRSVALSDAQFASVVADNPELRLELSAQGELIVMSPTGGSTGRRNSRIIQRLLNWSDGAGGGVVFDSSTGFTLPNGAKRSPDAAWVTSARWEALSEAEQETFPPLCPDFVIELRSPTDNLAVLKAKLEEYRENGARLGWLLDPQEQRAFVYRPGEAVEVFIKPEVLHGERVLQGFVLNVSEVWKA